MPNERASELMYDTASTLRLLDAELGELAPRKPVETAAAQKAVSDGMALAIAASEDKLTDLPALFVRAMGEVHAMLASIRNGREQIRAATTERLSHSNQKLGEVSSTTESAAIDIMDALERAIANVDELETEAVLTDSARGYRIRGDLREELFAVMGHMQFQDITSQQIMHVQSMLADMEARLADMAARFGNDPGASATARPVDARPATRTLSNPSAFDPNASLADAEARQALADSLVGRSPRGV